MKAKDLITLLMTYDPEGEVWIEGSYPVQHIMMVENYISLEG